MALSGPRTGRLLGSLACLLGGVTVALEIVARGQLDWWLFGPAVVVQLAVLVRLFLLVSAAHEPRTDRRPRLSDDQAARVLDATEVAVIATDESLPTVQTALLAACDAVGLQRVMLVGSDRRHRDLAQRLGVRAVAADDGWQAGLEAAVESASTMFLAITSASTAVVPRTLAGMARYLGPRCAWVQTLAIAPERRRPLDHLDQLVLGPAADSKQAGAWTGVGSLVTVEPFRAVGVERGPLAVSIALQQQGWHGRSVRGTLALAQGDAGAAPAIDQSIDLAAQRIRVLAGRRSPLWALRLTWWQRIAHLRAITDDLAGAAYAVAVAVTAVALSVGIAPVPVTAPVVIGLVVTGGLAAWARTLLSDGLLRPGRLAQSTADDMAASVLSLARALGAWRSGGSRGLTIVAIVVLEVALAMRAALSILGHPGSAARGVDLAVMVMGLAVLIPLLGASRVVVRARTLRASRRAPAPMGALVDAHQAQVTDLGADGVGLVVRGLVDLLSTVTIRLMPPDRAPIDLRGQVVRTRAVEGGTLIGVRLIGGVGRRSMDDYVRLWIDRVSRAGVERPQLRREEAFRTPAGRRAGGGLGALRLATVLTLVTVGVASAPPYRSGAEAPARAELGVSIDAPATALLGGELPFRTTVCNGGADLAEAVMVRLVVQGGVAVVTDATNWAIAPDEVRHDDPATGSTTVLWRPVGDLAGGACVDLPLRLMPAADGSLEPGDDVRGTVTAWFGGETPTDADDGTQAEADVATTIVPITVSKTSTAPAGRVVRGASGPSPEFILQVDVAPGRLDDAAPAGNVPVENVPVESVPVENVPVENVMVDDYLPAGIEFRGCAAADGCVEPDSVQQVDVDPDGAGPLTGGRYTHLRWSLGSLDAGASRQWRYTVAVSGDEPLATVASVAAGTGDHATSAEDGSSADDSRQWASAVAALTPVDTLIGLSACPGGGASAASGACAGSTSAGASTAWSATVSTTSERPLEDATLTVTIGDGLAYTPGSARLTRGTAAPEAIEPDVTLNTDGTQTLGWAFADAIAPGSEFRLDYATTTLTTLRASGAPVLVFDRLTTAVALRATSTAGTSTSASISSPWRVAPDSAAPEGEVLVVSPADGTAAGSAATQPCDRAVVGAGADGGSDAAAQAPVGYRPGDLACFDVRLVLPADAAARDVGLTLELPEQASYAGFAVGAGTDPASVVQVGAVAPAGGTVAFQVGTDPTVSPRYTLPGQVVHLVIAARWSSERQAIDDRAAMVSVRAALTGGGGHTVVVHRELPVRMVVPSPTVALEVVEARRADRVIDTSDLGQGDDAVLWLTIGNQALRSTAADATGQAGDASTVEVAVELADGLGCDSFDRARPEGDLRSTLVALDGTSVPSGERTPQLSAITCTDDVLSFTVDVIPAGRALRLELSLRIGASVGSAREFTIAGGIRQFTDVDGTEMATDSAAMRASTTVTTATAALARRVSASVVEPGNSADEATIGETVTFTVDLRVPAGTTLYDSAVASALPAGLAYVPSSVRVVSSPLQPAAFGPSSAPTGWSLEERSDGWVLTMPDGTSGWANPGPSTATIRLEYEARVEDIAANTAGSLLDDATVWSWNRRSGSDPVAVRAVDPRPITLVEPLLAVQRTAAPEGPYNGGAGVFVTMAVSAAATGSTAHDLVLVDCAPAVLGAVIPTAGAGWSAEVGAAGSCAQGGTAVRFSAASLEPGATTEVGYSAVVAPGVSAGAGFVGETSLTASTSGVAGADARPVTATGESAPMTIESPTLTSASAVGQAARGKTVDHIATITLPARTRVFDMTVLATAAGGLDIADFTAPSPAYGPTCVVSGVVGHTITPVDQVAGWFLGDVSAGDQPCVMTMGLRTRAAADAREGADLTLVTAASWATSNTVDDRTSATTDGLDQSIDTTSTLRVVAPAVTIGRTVDDTDRDVEGGQSVIHTITLGNSGDSAAYRIDLSEALPAGLAATDTFGGTCDGVATPTVAADRLTWSLFTGATGLEPGASCTVSYRAQLAAATSLTDGQTLSSTAGVVRYLGDAAPAAQPTDDQIAYTGKTAAVTLTAVRPTLRIDLTAGDGSERIATQLGTPTAWRIVVNNVSSGAARLARGIDIVDVLPPNWTFTDVTKVTPQRCAVMPMIATVEQTQTITWSNLCDLQAGEELTIEYRATAQLAAIGSPGLVDGAGNRIVHTNTATLSAEDAAGTTLGSAENSAGATLESVDLQVRTTDPGPADDATMGGVGFAVGVPGAYFVDVSNNGPDTVTGPVTLVDTVPAGYLVTGATGTGWECAVTTVVTCTHPGPVDVDSALPRVTIVGVPTGAALNDADGDGNPGTGLAVNRASVSSGQPDRLPTNDTDEESTPVRRLTDVAISAEWSATTPLVAGAQVTGAITVAVVGPSPGTGQVAVNDDLPAGLRLVRVRGAGWNCVGSRVGTGYTADPDMNGRIACTRAIRELAPGSPLEPIEVIVQVDPAQMSATALTARVSHPNDIESGNDVLSVAGSSATTARLTVRAEAGNGSIAVAQPGAAVPGAAVMVMVTNQGPSAEPGPVKVGVRLPSGVTPGEVEAPGWGCVSAGRADSGTGVGAVAGDLTCTWVGDDTAPDAVGVAEVLPTIVVPLSVGAAAVATSDPDAPNLVRITASVVGVKASTPLDDSLDVKVRPAADVVAAVSPSDTDPWRAGRSGSYAVVVTNNGPSDEYGPVTVSKPIPLGTTFEAGRGDGWSCQVDRGAGGTADLVTCTHGRGAGLGTSEALLPVGESLSPLLIDVSVGAGLLPGPSAAPVTVSGTSAVRGTTDHTWSTADDQVTVEPVVDLSVSRSGEASRLPVGTEVTSEVWVTNSGPNPAAAGVQVTDTLPAGVELASWAGEGWTCLASAIGPTCTFAEPIGVGETRAVSLTVVASPAAYTGADPVTGTMTVSGVDAEARPDDNTAGYTVEVAPLIDLAVAQSPTGRLVVGRRTAWTIEVRNLGPTAPSGEVTIADDLPAGVSFGTVDADGWDCVVEGQRLRCTYRGPLDIDSPLPPIEVPVSVDSEEADGAANVVGVWAPHLDADASNNVADRTLVVRRPGSVVAEPFSGLGAGSVTVGGPGDASIDGFTIDVRADDPPALGVAAAWSIDAANSSDDTLHDVVVRHVFPASERPLKATSTEGLCAIVGNEVRCSFDTVAAARAVSVDVMVETVDRPESAGAAAPTGFGHGVRTSDTRSDGLPSSWRPVWLIVLGVVALLLVLSTAFVVVVAPQYRPRLARLGRGRRAG